MIESCAQSWHRLEGPVGPTALESHVRPVGAPTGARGRSFDQRGRAAAVASSSVEYGTTAREGVHTRRVNMRLHQSPPGPGIGDALNAHLGLPDNLIGDVYEAVSDGPSVDEAQGQLVAGLAEEALAG